jgi:hypothetical protein
MISVEQKSEHGLAECSDFASFTRYSKTPARVAILDDQFPNSPMSPMAEFT